MLLRATKASGGGSEIASDVERCVVVTYPTLKRKHRSARSARASFVHTVDFARQAHIADPNLRKWTELDVPQSGKALEVDTDCLY